MKIPALLTCLFAAVLSVLPMGTAHADDDVSFDVFYNSLGDDGDWYNTPEFGYVWQPSIAYQNAKWRPYSDGYWAQTDDGWTWVSYENFGWATYHYGRWTNLENTGWVWVPGYDWGPGWVSWRTSDDYVGWAPLPPRRASAPNVNPSERVAYVDYNTVEDEDGYYNDVDDQYDIGPTNYCFVQTADFGAPVLREVIVPPQRNIVIIENTYNVTNITYRRDNNFVIVHNGGPDFAFIRTRVHHPIQELRIERRNDLGFLRDPGRDRHNNPNVVRNGVFQIAAPRINRRQVDFNQVRPPRIKQELPAPRVEHGWHNSGADQATVDRVRQKFQQQARDRSNRPGGPRPDQQRQQANVLPNANASPTPGAPGAPRTDADRQARRDAAQRDREQRDAARNGNNPPNNQPGATPAPGTTPPVNNQREDRRNQRQQQEQDRQAAREQQRQQQQQQQQADREQKQQRQQEQQQQRQQQQDQQKQQREQQQQQRAQEQQQRQQDQQTQRQQQQEQRQQQREQRQQDQPQRQQEQQADREQKQQRQQDQQAQRQQQQDQQNQQRQQRQQEQQAQRQQEQSQRQQQQQAERQQRAQEQQAQQHQQQEQRSQQQQQERAQQQQHQQEQQAQRQEQHQQQREQRQQQQQPQQEQGDKKKRPDNG